MPQPMAALRPVSRTSGYEQDLDPFGEWQLQTPFNLHSVRVFAYVVRMFEGNSSIQPKIYFAEQLVRSFPDDPNYSERYSRTTGNPCYPHPLPQEVGSQF